jgi:DNA (cytosine-5)-methyltransferase 1
MAKDNIILSSKKIAKTYFSIVSLFSGAGGMDMGFAKHGFKIIWANDVNRDACLTHQYWSSSDIIQDDISNINISDIPNSDVVIGGFPCQGFSLAGPRKIDDKRNSLYRFFVNIVEQKQPLAFVAENVKGILTLGNGSILDAIIEDFRLRGYDVSYQLINAADYGVPQDRYRIILVGLRNDLNIQFQFPTTFEHKVTLKEALSKLKSPNSEDVSYAPYSSRFMSRNRRRDWREVSFTIPATAKQVPLHPSSPEMIKIDSETWKFGQGITRRFSWQEAAAIQTFPEGFEFYGNLDSKYKQIGNAVPIKLAEAIASSLYNTLIFNLYTKEVTHTAAEVGV